ncbi:MAG: Dabb family protein [Planctomycetes bacterium]|nr:Dabb family protein [Planctomycetota bacterium]
MPSAEPLLAHNVYFTLQDASAEAVERMIAACHRYLKNHPGVVFYAAGGLEPELARPVNDRDFHVALHIVFRDRASHDAYQQSPEHVKFIEENRAGWQRVRVFDSLVTNGG